MDVLHRDDRPASKLADWHMTWRAGACILLAFCIIYGGLSLLTSRDWVSAATSTAAGVAFLFLGWLAWRTMRKALQRPAKTKWGGRVKRFVLVMSVKVRTFFRQTSSGK